LRTRILILSGVIVGLLVVAAGAAYAYDQSRKHVVGQGVQAGGVPLQGLTRAQARAKLDRLIMEPLARPIVVHHDKSTWKLGAREARIAVDLDAIVDDAMARSRSGDMFSRTVRNLTGASLNADLKPTVNYSDRAVIRMLDKVRRAIDRPAREATVKINAGGVQRNSSRTGLAVRASSLHRKIRRALVSTTADRTMVARTRKIQPKVSTNELDERYRTIVIINRNSFQLTLYKKLRQEKTFRIAVGKVGLETPAGLYNIQNKAINPAWHVPDSDWAGDLRGKVIAGDDPSNPLKARWLGIYDGAGIHGTDADGSIGTAASHGCIRMRIPDVIELYDEVPVGAPVYIAYVPDASPHSAPPPSARRGPGGDLRDRDLLPASGGEQGVMVGVAKYERADEHAPLPLAHHREPHRRRVAAALHPVPRPRRRRRVDTDPGVDELAPRRHLTAARIDEERRHRHRG